MPSPLPVPASGTALITDPGQVAAAFRALNSVLTAKRKLVRPQAILQLGQQVQPLFTGAANGTDLLVNDPYQFETAIADPTGGATVDTQCRAVVAALLAQLRKTGQLPS